MHPWFCNMKGVIISLWLVIMSIVECCFVSICVHLCPWLILMFDASMSMLDLYSVLVSMFSVYFIYMSNASMLVLVSDAYSTFVSMSNVYSMYLSNVYSIFVSVYMSNVDSMFMTMSMSNVFRVYCWNVCVCYLLLLYLLKVYCLCFFFNVSWICCVIHLSCVLHILCPLLLCVL